MGELRKESGSKAGGKDGGGRGGEGEEGAQRGEVLEEDEEGVRSRPPMTGEGRRVTESVVTPGALTGGGEQGRAGGAGEAGLVAGGGRAGESSSCPERVSDRFLPAPASSPLAPPSPLPLAMAVVAMTMTAF